MSEEEWLKKITSSINPKWLNSNNYVFLNTDRLTTRTFAYRQEKETKQKNIS